MLKQLFLSVGVVWAVIALGLLVWSWMAIRRGDVSRHRSLMILLTAAAWLFMLLYLLRYRIPDMVPHVPAEYIPWIAFHGTVALFPLIGASVLVWARWREKRHPGQEGHLKRNHKYYGRVLILLWAFTHLGGIVNAFLFD